MDKNTRAQQAKKDAQGQFTNQMFGNADMVDADSAVYTSKNDPTHGANAGFTNAQEIFRSNPTRESNHDANELPPFPEWTAKYHQ